MLYNSVHSMSYLIIVELCIVFGIRNGKHIICYKFSKLVLMKTRSWKL